jgi:hypothetical protein
MGGEQRASTPGQLVDEEAPAGAQRPAKGECQDFNKKGAGTSFRLSTNTAPPGLISFAAILA